MPLASFQQIPLIILGAGYTGQFLFSSARASGWKVFATSRNPEMHLPNIPSTHRLLFNLDRPETWKNLPAPAFLVWCFPANPSAQLRQFASDYLRQTEKLILLGSTSAYVVEQDHITEESPLKWELPRVQTEEFLRDTYGAIVIRLSGIYGPGRNPINWIRTGRIRHARKWVNLIHVRDAAQVCLWAIEHGKTGESYIASDGKPRRWEDILSYANEKWNVSPPHPIDTVEMGKRVFNRKLRRDLKYHLQFPDLFSALDQIETPSL